MDKAHGLRFSESLSGYMSGESDHWAAYEAGRAAGLHARFWVTVSIPNLEALIADPEHEASLSGRVAIAGLGESLDVQDGRVCLFCRRGDETRLLYYLPFSQGGRSFLLRGEKRLTRPRGPEAWKQMTTLYSELVQQADGEDALIRRGVLRIGAGRVMVLGTSFRPIGTRSPVRFLADWARFLRFSSRQIQSR